MAHLSERGYVLVHRPSHPRARSRGVVFEHILVAEAALGRHLPAGAVVHHVNGDKADNRGANLVVCQDQTYHLLLHRRQRALEACGDPGWVLCYYCQAWGAPDGMTLRKGQYHHRACAARWQREYRLNTSRHARRRSA